MQMILDSRSDIEIWFLEAFYEIKKEFKELNKNEKEDKSNVLL